MKKNLKKKVAALPKIEHVSSDGFGNRCNICGSYFEDGTCNNGHEKGKTYPKQK